MNRRITEFYIGDTPPVNPSADAVWFDISSKPLDFKQRTPNGWISLSAAQVINKEVSISVPSKTPVKRVSKHTTKSKSLFGGKS